MIKIFTGDDQAVSRSKFSSCIRIYKESNYFTINITSENLPSLIQVDQDKGLFNQGTIYYGENLLSKKKTKEIINKISDENRNLTLILWDEGDNRFIKKSIPKAEIIESRQQVNIFKFLDSITPGNLKGTCTLFKSLNVTVDINIIFFMLFKRIRELLLIDNREYQNDSLAPWQTAKLLSQKQKWNIDKLLSFYDGLYKIEVRNKTSDSYYSLSQALEILFSLYL